MPVLLIKVPVLVIADLDDAILHTESIPIIIAHFMMMDLHEPVIDILAVEQRNPLFLCPGGMLEYNSQQQHRQRS